MEQQTDRPCCGCTERNAYCHSTCEKYKAFREEIDRLNAIANKRKLQERFLYDDITRIRDKARKHRKRK